MLRLTLLKSFGIMIISAIVMGCAQGPEYQANHPAPQAVEVAQADTVAISPVGVMKANYEAASTDVAPVDNNACNAKDFCPLPIRKPKATAID